MPFAEFLQHVSSVRAFFTLEEDAPKTLANFQKENLNKTSSEKTGIWKLHFREKMMHNMVFIFFLLAACSLFDCFSGDIMSKSGFHFTFDRVIGLDFSHF